MPDGRLAYRLKTRWRDGTTHVLMERRELLERLAPLVPPPRAHQVRYHGLLAPCAGGRDRVVPRVAEVGAGSADPPGSESQRQAHFGSVGHEGRAPLEGRPDVECGTTASPSVQPESPHAMGPPNLPSGQARFDRQPETASAPSLPPRRHPWAELLQRVFEVDALCCPRCGSRMRILAAITDADVARRILACLALPTRAPPAVPARASPEPMPSAPLDTLAPAHDAFDWDQRLPAAWDVGA